MDFHVQQHYRVIGMSCAACAHSVTSLLSAQPGVVNATVNYGTQTAAISFRSTQTSTQKLREGLQLFGYDILPQVPENEAEIERRDAARLQSLKRSAVIGSVLCVPLVVLGMDMQASSESLLVQGVLSLAVMLLCGRDFFVHAFQQARRKSVSMDTLVALSTGLAFVWSLVVVFQEQWLHSLGIHGHVFFESAAVIVATVLIGKVVEENAKQKARGATAAIRSLVPARVRRIRSASEAVTALQTETETQAQTGIETGNETEIPIQDLQSGDILRVLPGERFPADGVVHTGTTFVDESFLTGESAPVPKAPGSVVFAGTLNHDGVVIMDTRSVADDTMIRSIERAVRAAQDTHVAAQRFVDFASSVFVPAILAIALITFAVWCGIGGIAALPTAIASAITVLIVACPCALGLAAPIALVVGIQRAASKGILVKDAEALERAASVSDVIFDKTGTLTDAGTVTVHLRRASTLDFTPLAGILYTVERGSSHPHAKAIVRELESKGAQHVKEVTDIREHPGQGMSARWDGQIVLVGSLQFVEQSGVNVPEQMRNATVIFAVGERVACAVDLQADLGAHAADVVALLRARGVNTHLLSGDTQEAVERAAAQVRITHAEWRCTPEQKERYVQELQQRGAVVAMVGDGMNDAQSLARADVSIAMGRGSDIAQHAAQFVLVGSDIRGVNTALDLARRTMRVVRQNLVWAFGYNVLLIPIATGFFDSITGLSMDPMMAGIAMAMSSISVVSNSLRLRRA